jgi:glycosyltransferase involved in cell wall biosynthesis
MLCQALVDRGAEVTVASRLAAPSTPLLINAKSIPIRFVSTPFAANQHWFRISTLWASMFWSQLLKPSSFDLLYTSDISRFTRFLMRFLSPQGKFFLMRAGDLMTDSDKIGAKLPLPDALIVESDVQADAVRAVCGAAFPVVALPMLGYYERQPRRRERDAGAPLRICFLGRFHKDKGIFRLLDVWPELHIEEGQLFFYGYGPARDRLQAEIVNRGLSNKVTVEAGWQSREELADVFASSDLLLLPSETEGLPTLLLEAMAHGVPFVATDVGAVHTLAIANPDVMIVPNNNDAFSKAVTEMVAKIRSNEIDGARLQAYHQQHYCFTALTQRWVDLSLNEQFRPATATQESEVAAKAAGVN